MSDFEIRELDNGVKVLLALFKDGETVTIGVSYNVGGRNEWKRDASYDGISHFLEHQFFKGDPEKTTPLQVHQKIDSLGGMTNAFTTEQATCYFTKCLSEEVNEAIDLWSELLTYGKIAQEEFDKEAFVVKQEFRSFEDTPHFYLQTHMQKKLFEGTSLEMDVIGNEESLSSVTVQQMEEYRDEHYDLKNAILMLLGNFDRDEVYKRLNKRFGQRKLRMDKPHYELTQYEVPTKSEMRVVKIEKETPLVYIGTTIKTPGGRSEDKPALDLLSAFLSMGKSSMVQEKLVRTGITAFAFSYISTFEDTSSLNVIAGVPPPMLEKAHEGLFKMLYELLRREVKQEDLTNLCDRIENLSLSSSEEPLSLIFSQGFGYWNRGKFQTIEEAIVELRAVTMEEFSEVRRKVLGEFNGVYGILGKIAEFEPKFPEGTWKGEFKF